MTKSTAEFHFHVEAGKSPTLLMLHGTGGNEHDLVGLAQAVAPGATILSPRGQVLENGQPRFFRRLAEGVFDIEDLHARTAELADWVERITKDKEIDDQPIVAVGFSNGANIAGSLLLSRPELLAGAILLRPMVPFVPDPVPALDGVPVLIAAGTQDQLIALDESRRLEQLLRNCGADVEMAWQEGGHGLMQSDLDSARTWLANHAW